MSSPLNTLEFREFDSKASKIKRSEELEQNSSKDHELSTSGFRSQPFNSAKDVKSEAQSNELESREHDSVLNKVIMSKAQRRKLKKPPIVVTNEMKEQARERTRELRKHLRILKSNGARRKIAKMREKRKREHDDYEEGVSPLDSDYHIRKKGRRM